MSPNLCEPIRGQIGRMDKSWQTDFRYYARIGKTCYTKFEWGIPGNTQIYLYFHLLYIYIHGRFWEHNNGCNGLNENQHFPPNLTSSNPWPWYVIVDLIIMWRNPYCSFDLSLVVIGPQLFKGDPNNENLTKLEHTCTHRRNALSQNPPAFQGKGTKRKINK